MPKDMFVDKVHELLDRYEAGFITKREFYSELKEIAHDSDDDEANEDEDDSVQYRKKGVHQRLQDLQDNSGDRDFMSEDR
jgi:hypothetical protein